jgi:hypothetical protein
MDSELGRGESPNVRMRAVVLIMAGILTVLLAIAFGFQVIFPDRIGQTYTVHHAFPLPAVIPDERAERLALEARQRKDLAGGHERVPIGAAMKAIVARGSHAFDPVETGP